MEGVTGKVMVMLEERVGVEGAVTLGKRDMVPPMIVGVAAL